MSNPQKPPWIRVRIPGGEKFKELRALVREKELHTVCTEALCPNIGDCWGRGTATFLILGDVCTRSCGFCGIRTGMPAAPELDEPARVAEAVFLMNLNYAVITSVTRDDLPDGGAAVFAKTIGIIRGKVPQCKVEVLVPDFRGDSLSISTVVDASPRVFGHNMETVQRLYPEVRPQARYSRSLAVLEAARAKDDSITTKSGFMVGLGETHGEVLELIADLRNAGCSMLTIGQYLRPTRSQLPVARYCHPEEFDFFRREALALGFTRVKSGPLVRSSYHAEAFDAEQNRNLE